MTALPIVFLHAFPLSAEMWREELADFTDRIAFAPDFPGFGERPAAGASVDAFADAVVEDMNEAGIEQAVLVGLSMGGYVAFRIHSRWPDRVAGLVLADTRSGADGEEAAQRRSEQAERARLEGVAWLADEMQANILGETTRRERPAVVAAVRRLISRADPEGVARALLAMRDRPDSTPELPRIQVPVLAVVGEEDTLTPIAEARAIADGVKHGHLATIPGAGHLVNLEAPTAFRDALRDYLRRHAL